MKVLLINDTESHYHWGCTGTSLALKQRIRSLGFDLMAIPHRPAQNWINIPKTQIEFQDEDIFNKFCKSEPELISQIQAADILVINGEGTIHGGLRPGPLSLLYVAYIAKIHFKKNVQIINHQVYLKDLSPSHLSFGLPSFHSEEENNKAAQIYACVYQNLDFVAIREPISFEEVRHWNPTSTLAFDCLPLYIKEHYPFCKKIKNCNKVLVMGGSVAWEPCAIPEIAKYLKKMHSEGYAIQILIGAKGDPALDDHAFIYSLKQSFDTSSWTLINADSLKVWLDTLCNADLIVSGRFHYTIAAACLNTKFLVFNSNTLKNHALSQILGAPEPLYYSSNNLCEQLITRTQETLKAPFSLNPIEKLCEAAEKNFNGLRQLKLQSLTSSSLRY